jgi:hypothetical protein
MGEIDYVRFHAAADRGARAEAIVELRRQEAENARLWQENRELRRRLAELEAE